MPATFVFLLKVNLALLLFCAGYYLILRHLTFYTLNRIYLFTAIVFASVYPEINLSNFASRHQEIAKPIILNWQNPARLLAQPDYWYWAGIVFWIGAAVFALRLVIQLYSLFRIYRSSKPMEVYNYNIRAISNNANPFSFWKSIYVNPDKHDPIDLKSILMHEQVHIDELHTIDILLAEISTIFYWFNPGIWLIKKAIRENIEFITDRKILKKGIDTKQYQYSLVNVSFSAEPNSIVNNFNISTIKKRIIMMNAKRSSRFNLTRYVLLVPAVVVLLLAFNITKAAYAKKNISLKNLITNLKPVSKDNNIKLIKSTHFNNAITKKNITGTALKSVTFSLKAADTNIAKLTDTNKRKGKMITLTLDNKQPADYVIDGKVAEDDELKKINPGDITSINIKKTDPENKDVVYVLTKNNAEIKPINIAVVAGKPSINRIYIDTIKHGKHIETINITGRLSMDTNTSKQQIKVIQFKTAPLNLHKVSSNISFAYASSNSFSLNHFSDKVIVIDGNIASEKDLKKLSAFDIDKMIIKTDQETKELYGDKAKNGVIFILTRKGK